LRLYLACELAVLFVGIPAAMARRAIPRAPIPTLLVACAACVLALTRDPTFDRGALWNAHGALAHAGGVAGLFGLLALALAGIAAWLTPHTLFDFVREQPRLWALVMVFYPLVSVYPQEIVYRAFFFHRYAALFPDTATMAVASAAAFAFGHVMFPRPWVAMGLTLLGGLLFGYHYAVSRSLLLVSVEHALFGQVLFTVGLGRFFYHRGVVEAGGGLAGR
jgi:membrane protease YdiL (CAAX protease family)